MDEISILYPLPPPYYKVFTKENVTKLEELKRKHPAVEELRALDSVEGTNLKYLVPPEAPKQEIYHSFGSIWQFKDKFMNLNDAGVQQLYPESATSDADADDEDIFTVERIQELKKMTKSLLLNFLELVGLLVKNPYYINGKVEQIRIILINLHHLLNSYRLHQSREDLILKIEDKIQATLEEVNTIDSTVALIEDKFRGLLKKIDSVESESRPGREDVEMQESRLEDDRELLIETVLGGGDASANGGA